MAAIQHQELKYHHVGAKTLQVATTPQFQITTYGPALAQVSEVHLLRLFNHHVPNSQNIQRTYVGLGLDDPGSQVVGR